MPYPYTVLITEVTGNVLSATDYNNEHQNHINNNIPGSIGGDSANVAGMQATVDPGGVGSESLSTDLKGELERIRYVLTKIHGGAQWYVYPASSALLKGGGTMAGNIAMSGFKETGLGAGTTAGDSARYEQLKILQVVSATQNGAVTSTSATFTNTGLSVSITPASVNNKILVIASGCLGISDNKLYTAYATLARGGTNLGDSTNGFADIDCSPGTGFQMRVPCHMTFLDSPASVAALTYTVQYKSSSVSGTVTWGFGQTTITVMEIAP